MTDPIADMLTRIRNGIAAGHQRVEIPVSKIKIEIARILREEGYISNYKVLGNGTRTMLRVYLKYGPAGERVIQRVERASKPGSRYYVGWEDIPRILGGLGISIISTSRGLMTGREARRRKLGGELLCQVY